MATEAKTTKTVKTAKTTKAKAQEVQETTPVQEVQETTTTPIDFNIAGLETALSKTARVEVTDAPQWDNREWLESQNPADYHTPENTPLKFNADAEAKIFDGLNVIPKLAEIGFPINETLILLAKWYEVKPARASIRKMLADEANSLGFEKDVFLEIEIGEKQLDVMENLISAYGRLRTVRTFFKPREGKLSTKIHMTPIEIKGVGIYSIATSKLIKARNEFAGDKSKLRQFVLDNGELQNMDIESI